MIGQNVGRYKVTAKLGSGGMGEVFLAEDTKLDRQVALKFLPASMWNEAEAQQRLIREAKSASKLDHPNIVTIYGIEEFEGRPFIVMAHVRGVRLSEYIASEHRTIDELIDLSIQIAEGLQHAHEAGVIHRDLKPGNILVNDKGRVRILDFGIARLRGTTRLTQVGSTVGTLAYSPPELAQGKDAEPTSDVYSLGVVIYQMLAGRLPFDADHEAALLYSILHEPPIPLSESRTDIPSKLQNLVLRCLEKQPEKRFASCTELISELKRCRATSSSGNATAPAPARPSIAVLPFTNMSADPENEYFSDGLSEELLNVLAKNPGLRVTGRTSSFAFKGKHEDLREIGQKLGVETLLEGSVRKAGNRVRITTQLVKVTNGFHLWSETYDRVLDDIFAVQDDIAKSVATAMNVTLLGKTTPKTHGNAETFGLLMQANHFMSQLTRESLKTAKSLYERALEIEPEDARAWAGLARCLMAQGGYGFIDDGFGSRAATEACLRALAIDNSIAEPHYSMGYLQLFVELDWKRAGESFRRALELAPNDGRMMIALANYEAFRGNFARAIPLAEEAIKLDPLNAQSHLFAARTFWLSGNLERASDFYRKALQLSPEIASAHASLSGTLAMQGKLEEALTEAMKEPPSGYRDMTLAIIYSMMGRRTESDQSLSSLIAAGEQWGFQIAIVYAVREETDQAFAWLGRALELKDSGIVGAKVQPMLSSLHGDPRWAQFLKKLGLDA